MVVGVEDTSLAEGSTAMRCIEVHGDFLAGNGVREKGSDVASGDVLLPAGHIVTAADIGSLLMAKVFVLDVRAEPVVGIVSTGDEIAYSDGVEAGIIIDGPSKVWDANSPMLKNLLGETCGTGVDVTERGVCQDSFSAVLLAICTAALWSDFVIFSGGVSMGDRDFVKPALETLVRGGLTLEVATYKDEKICCGIQVTSHDHEGYAPGKWMVGGPGTLGTACVLPGRIGFGRLSMKPGKPTTLAQLVIHGETSHHPIFLGLPGNPASAWVCGQLFAVPLAKGLQGIPWEACLPPKTQVRIWQALPLDSERSEFHRAVAQWWGGEGGGHGGKEEGEAGVVLFPKGCIVAHSTGAQASSRLQSTLSANCLLHLPAGKAPGEILPRGSIVEAYLLSVPHTGDAAVAKGLVLQHPLEGGRESAVSRPSTDCSCSSPSPHVPHKIEAPHEKPMVPCRVGILTVS